MEREVVTEEDVEGRGEREKDVEKSEDGGVLILCLGVGGGRCVCVGGGGARGGDGGGRRGEEEMGGREREKDVEKSEDGGVLISCLGVGGRRCVCVCVCVFGRWRW